MKKLEDAEMNMRKEKDFQPFQSNSPRVGILVQWMDDKGFGWVESGGKRWFVHIKDFDRGQGRPKEGEEVRFMQGVDPKGRACAKRVTFVKGGGAAGVARGRMGIGGWIVLALLLALPALALLWFPVSWWLGVAWMSGVSGITYVMYAHDKDQAVSNGWRVTEASLHLAEILGGWPGALLAQRRLRHKCAKPTYQAFFWFIVLIYQVVSVDVILNQRLSRMVIGFLNR